MLLIEGGSKYFRSLVRVPYENWEVVIWVFLAQTQCALGEQSCCDRLFEGIPSPTCLERRLAAVYPTVLHGSGPSIDHPDWLYEL